jgi:DinB superfamily
MPALRGIALTSIPDLRPILKSQYHAGLAMLRETIDRCPDEEWLSRDRKNAFWQVAYHVLFYTHLYLQPNEAAFVQWTHQHGGDDGTTGEPYSKPQVLEYWAFVDQAIDSTVDALDLENSESGFWWYKMSKLEHQLVNIRHLQHHSAQLCDRLRSAANIGIKWVSGSAHAHSIERTGL